MVAAGDTYPEGISSLLDSDLYKFTMLAAVLAHYPDVEVSYKYTNRTPSMALSPSAVEWLRGQISNLAALRLTTDERDFLQRKCPYFSPEFLDYLSDLRLQPDQDVHMVYDEATRDLKIRIDGLWSRTILYEIPLLALVSEAYFKFVDTDWSYDGQEDKAYEKACRLIRAGCAFSDFGARRRRDYHTQDLVLAGLTRAQRDCRAEGAPGMLIGTSNVHFAHKYDLAPIGTVAHEWFMATGALTNNYLGANRIALERWHKTYGNYLSIALTDTFGTEAFLKDFTHNGPDDLAACFSGLRQDSGDPAEFCKRAVQHYRDIGIDPSTKTIVFSDSLNVDRAIWLKHFADEQGIKCSFGIGTFLTNDFRAQSDPTRKSPAMNIVIKISSCQGKPAVKISDDFQKNTGDREAVRQVKAVLGII